MDLILIIVLKIQNLTSADIEDMPKFEYYELENWVLCYYYPYMTLVCQGGAFVAGVLYRYWYILDKDVVSQVSHNFVLLASLRTDCGTCGGP